MLFLIYGGSASGKSALAERLMAGLPGAGQAFYLATMRPTGADAAARVARHREQRAGKGFVTLERYTRLEELRLPAAGSVLLECLGNLVANELFDGTDDPSGCETAVCKGLSHLSKQARHLVIVSNDVSGDGVDYPSETRRYQELLARLNNRLAARSDVCVEVVCGLPIIHTGAEVCRLCGL